MNQGEGLWGIVFFESEKRIFLPYSELSIDFADERLSLTDALEKEADKINEFRINSKKKERLMDKLEDIYRNLRKESNPELKADYQKRILKGPHKKERLDDLEKYFSIPHTIKQRIVSRNTHNQLLSELEDYLLEGPVDYGAYSRTLVRFILNYTLIGHSDQTRKSGMPYAWHPIDAARILVKNSQDSIVVCGTLLHDVLEERLNKWLKERVEQEKIKIKEDLLPEPEKDRLTDWERVIRDNKDEYYEVATTEFYSMALSFYRHVNFLPSSTLRFKLHKDIFNIMQIVAKLSRTNNVSYYNYLQRLFYQDPKEKLDKIEFDRLKNLLEAKVRLDGDPFVDPDLLWSYLKEVDNIKLHYAETQRNVFREILVKIADRLNNTRDVSALNSPAKRLYNSGYKNAYAIQAIEAKIKKVKLTSEEKVIVERKFLNKLKVSALYQMILEINRLERELPEGYIEKTKAQLEEYKKTDGFNTVTSSSDDNPFDGMINYFNFIANETNQKVRKQKISDLDADPKKLYAYALAFKSIFEHYLVYPIEMKERYKIAGFSASKLGQDEGEIPAITLRRNVVNITFSYQKSALF